VNENIDPQTETFNSSKSPSMLKIPPNKMYREEVMEITDM
jgi:hypothetical protein